MMEKSQKETKEDVEKSEIETKEVELEKSEVETKEVEVETKDEHPVFEAIKTACNDDKVEGNRRSAAVEAVRNFFEVDGVPVDIEDNSGMTPLMHACWKGNAELTAFLINQGADVNGGNHEHNYTTLHFAALAGKSEVCKILLEHGVKIDEINTVKRTASQMAAFVGMHECVAVINNFIPKEDVYYYTRKQPFEEEPKLPLFLAKPIHNLVMSMNTHPVRVAMMLNDDKQLLDNLDTVIKILELMSDREFKNRRDVNEVLSLKYHMFHYIVKDIKKQMDKDKLSEGEKKTPFIDRWIKSMLVGRDSDGYPVFQENFLRQGVKEFSFPEAQLFKALVTNFHHCRNYGEGMTAAEYINGSFNGQRGFKDFENCETCGNEEAPKKCSNCKSVQYCNQTCQKYHWFTHKKLCPKLKENYEARQTAAAAIEAEKPTGNTEE